MQTTFDFKKAQLKRIPTKSIRENTEALRTTVEKDTDKYKELVDSIRRVGVMNPIVVREVIDPQTKEIMYGLIDGLHRWTASVDAGLDEIPAQVGDIEEADLLEAQILANVHKIETTPVQYTKAILKIMGANPLLTLKEIGDRLSRSKKWIEDRLGLLKLTPEIQKLADSGDLKLLNAYALSRLPHDKQAEHLSSALSQQPSEFVGRADAILKEVNAAKREGRVAVDHFVPIARLKKPTEIKDEQKLATSNPAESKVIAAARAAGVNTVDAAIAYALNWTLNLDPVSVKADEAKWLAEKKAKEDAAEKRKLEREALKAKAAEAIVAKM